jgi:phage shock protein PspC (stress-responsive transcriptional regulator)
MTDARTCPYCAEEIRPEAVKCRHCGSRLDGRMLPLEWVRVEEGKMVAGVCNGLAEQFDVSVTVVRLAFVLATLLGFGIALPLYAVLWIIMPLQSRLIDHDERSILEPPRD